MHSPTPVPAALSGRPFTTAEARAHGIGRGVLAGRRFRRLLPGVWITDDLAVSFVTLLVGTLLVLPPDAVVSHTSAMRLWGFDRRDEPDEVVEASTNLPLRTRLKHVTLHRREGRITPYRRRGLPVTGPDRTFVDCALTLTLVELVQLGDHLLHARHTTLERLQEYARTRHLHGVRRARRALGLVRAGAESPMETLIRLMLVFARLPEPVCNVRIVDDAGRFLARGDLVYARWRVLVEYDGLHHERSAAQRRHDLRRRERLEAAGWLVIVITSADLRDAEQIPVRVHRALASRGHDGPPPTLSAVWRQWFTETSTSVPATDSPTSGTLRRT